MENKIRGFGATQSPYDHRTVQYQATAVAPLVTGGEIYIAGDHLDQWYVGICTSIWLIQNRRKANGKDYSWDFQYLLQKKFVDLNWDEGSSIFSSLKVGYNYGFLPANLWTHTMIADLQLTYSQYIAKLEAIPDTEISRLLALCVDKIAGYAQIDVSDPQALARAINDSQAGIGCRYEVGAEWYSPSTPLLQPTTVIGAHAIGMTWFNYKLIKDQKLANTWGEDWDEQGNADINWSTYKPTEAWAILNTPPVITQPTLKIGMQGDAVKTMQTDINTIMGSNLLVDGNFGRKTQLGLMAFQTSHNLKADGICGAKTWQAFNMIKIVTSVCVTNGIDPLVGIAVATWEGGLNPNAKLFNPPTASMPNGSTDRGLFQWNDFFHKEISDADAYDPTKATGWFCKYLNENPANLHGFWSASQHNWIKMLTPELKSKYGVQ